MHVALLALFPLPQLPFVHVSILCIFSAFSPMSYFLRSISSIAVDIAVGLCLIPLISMYTTPLRVTWLINLMQVFRIMGWTGAPARSRSCVLVRRPPPVYCIEVHWLPDEGLC